MESVDPRRLLSPLRRILLDAAVVARALFHQGACATRKANGTPVTEADLQIDAYLREALCRLIQEAGWLSEEGAADDTRLQREWVWVVDPLDGTKEFARGIPEFAVSIGLVREGEPILGGIVNPVTGEGGVGLADGTAEFWGMVPAPAAGQSLETAVACVSRSEIEDGSIAPLLGLVGAARPIGSVAYKLLRVAAGLEDLTFSVQPKSEWDICAGVALLLATGLVYRRFDAATLAFNQPVSRIRTGAVAGPASLAEAFLLRSKNAVTRACESGSGLRRPQCR